MEQFEINRMNIKSKLGFNINKNMDVETLLEKISSNKTEIDFKPESEALNEVVKNKKTILQIVQKCIEIQEQIADYRKKFESAIEIYNTLNSSSINRMDLQPHAGGAPVGSGIGANLTTSSKFLTSIKKSLDEAVKFLEEKNKELYELTEKVEEEIEKHKNKIFEKVIDYIQISYKSDI